MTYEKPATPKKADAKKPDPNNPPKLLEFMMQRWKPQTRVMPKPVKQVKAFVERRELVSSLFQGDCLVVPSGHEKVRANDTHYRFRPGTDFYYLTGNLEPDCVLVLVPKATGGHESLLFVEPNPGRSSETFYTDRKKGELWVGSRLGVEQSAAKFGLTAKGLPDLTAFLKKHASKARVVRGLSPAVDALVPRRDEARDTEFTSALSELRLIKDDAEIAELKTSVAATKRGFEDVIRVLKTAKSEREVEGVFNTRARVEGNDVGYGTIAASGAHACILHWTRNDGRLSKRELLLLDAGVEGNSLYTADITRTLPIGGRFSKEQREIYELVWQAQQAGFSGVAPGNQFLEAHKRAMQVLAYGLEALGILPMSADEALQDENLFYKRYSLHGVSHMLGLDVHDCACAREELYRHGPLQPGMVLTVEPGLYFQLDDLTVPAKYRGIGVRIEDDVLVTETGMKNLSASIPSEASDVEAWMRKVWRAW